MTTKLELLPCELHELFTYDSGALRWKIKPRKGIQVGDAIGNKDSNGRLRFEYRGRSYSVHVVIFAMHHGRWPIAQVDHINRIKTYNLIANLREATNAQNSRNRNGSSGTGFKGVSRHKGDGKYHSRISIGGENYFLGAFTDPVAAAKAYDAAAKRLHGDFALTNEGKYGAP